MGEKCINVLGLMHFELLNPLYLIDDIQISPMLMCMVPRINQFDFTSKRVFIYNRKLCSPFESMFSLALSNEKQIKALLKKKKEKNMSLHNH